MCRRVKGLGSLYTLSLKMLTPLPAPTFQSSSVIECTSFSTWTQVYAAVKRSSLGAQEIKGLPPSYVPKILRLHKNQLNKRKLLLFTDCAYKHAMMPMMTIMTMMTMICRALFSNRHCSKRGKCSTCTTTKSHLLAHFTLPSSPNTTHIVDIAVNSTTKTKWR
jgi:hypothetical protein